MSERRRPNGLKKKGPKRRRLPRTWHRYGYHGENYKKQEGDYTLTVTKIPRGDWDYEVEYKGRSVSPSRLGSGELGVHYRMASDGSAHPIKRGMSRSREGAIDDAERAYERMKGGN